MYFFLIKPIILRFYVEIKKFYFKTTFFVKIFFKFLKKKIKKLINN